MGRDCLAVNMSRQHICMLVLRVRVPLAVRVFWCLTRRTESLDKGLILFRKFSFVSGRKCVPVAAQTRPCLVFITFVFRLLLLIHTKFTPKAAESCILTIHNGHLAGNPFFITPQPQRISKLSLVRKLKERPFLKSNSA
jgi:hypothetical protein